MSLIGTFTAAFIILEFGDDATVVIENVEQYIKRALNETAMAAVFVPAAFIGGVTGVLYRQFALTITISTAISAFVALTLTPALCAMILMRKKFSAPLALVIIYVATALIYKNFP